MLLIMYLKYGRITNCFKAGGVNMVGLIGMLAGEILYEAAKFIIMILLLVVGVFIGGSLRKRSDAKKADKKSEDATGITE